MIPTSVQKKSSDALILCVGLRHLGDLREILVLKVDRRHNFYAFPSYAKKPIGPVDVHMSLHRSGERHFAVKLNGRQGKELAEVQKKSIVKFCPPSALKGVIELYHSGIFLNQFRRLFPIGTNQGEIVLLDAIAAGLRDDFIVIRAYSVSPGAEDQIPIFPDTGPRILHLVKKTVPWLAVEVYQQTSP